MTVWAIHPADTQYFGPGPATFMVNYRVKNLDAMLTQLRAAGAKVEEKVEDYDYGRFGWVTDPEGNRFEAVGAEVNRKLRGRRDNGLTRTFPVKSPRAENQNEDRVHPGRCFRRKVA